MHSSPASVPPTPPVALLPADDGVMRLALADPALFFRAPAIDPMAGSHLGMSGFDTIIQDLKERRQARQATSRLNLLIPAHTLTAGTEQRLRTALTEHIAAQVGAERSAQRLLAKQRLRAWQVGGAFLAICLLLASLIEQAAWHRALLGRLLSESLVIAGWVGLWRPLELTLYDWWPSHFRIQVLEQLGSIDLVVQPV